MTKKEQLIVAIRSRQSVSFTLHGQRRVGNPHILGDINGRLMLEIYQTAGGSSGGDVPQWRTVSVEDMHSLELTGESFSVDPVANPGNGKWDSLDAHV